MRFLLVLVCMSTLSVAQSKLPAYDLQGHRGCRGLLPENTVPAFLKALELGVNTLELDVVISQDRQVVVSHDPYFNADFTSDPTGTPVDKKEQKNLVLYKMPYAEIQRYDVGSTGNPAFPEQKKEQAYKPLLSEVITKAESYRKDHNLPAFSYNIEIKSELDQYNVSQPAPIPFSDLVYEVISKNLAPERVIIQSFDFSILQLWRKRMDSGQYKEVRLAALVENTHGIDKNLEDLGFVPDIYSPQYRLINKEQIDVLHQRGMKVIPWTVNSPYDMVRLLTEGVDGLITDYPDRAKNL